MVRLSIERKLLAVATAMLVSCAAATPISASQPSHKPSTWHPWFEIGGYHNSRDDDSTGTTGTNRGETTVFAPIRGSERTLLFGQLTAKFFDDSAKEGNLAFGYRQMMPWGFNLGAWIGGDVRRTDIDNTFWQLSGGFEALSKSVDIRLNWYGPVTAPQTGVAGFAQVQLQGNQISIVGGEEVGLKGVDGEVGLRLPTEYLKVDPNLFELRAYAGGYHFYSDDAEDNVTGVKGRLELRVNDVIASIPGSRLTAEYEVSHDDVRETRHDVGLRMRIPLSGGQSVRSLASLSHQQRRMLDGVERDTDIVTGRSKRESVEDALTGTDFDRVAYATTEVTTTSTSAGDNSLIIVNGEVQGAQNLRGSQTLMGGGSTISVRGRRTGIVLPFTAPGAAGRLTTPGDEANLTLAGSNTHVAGLTIVGDPVASGNSGIRLGDNRTNLFLTNLIISDVGDDGIRFDSWNEITVKGSSIFGALGDGIQGGDYNSISIVDLSIRDVAERGILLDDVNTVTIAGTTVANTTFEGIMIGDSSPMLQIADVTISNTGRGGLRIGHANVDIDINDVVIAGTGGSGISVGYENLSVRLAGISIMTTGDDGIRFGGENESVTVQNVSIAGTTESGISLGYNNFSVLLDNLNIANTAEHGVEIADRLNSIVANNLVLTDIGQSAFYIYQDTELRIANTTITGSIGDHIFNFVDGASTILPESTGNVNSVTTLGGQICNRENGGAPSGDNIAFVDGTIVNATTCP
ncbi:MAG: right-handed parallel beta-helix repeat-containing protein [Pseudomonadota bacterium]